jgi:tRNA nucleotidyltransferase (CCA-adding enzyme)
MDVYLVGGAVRDALLGLPVTERDYVVVGATEQEMLDAGYRTVGKDFPVFLHPETQEEYALARTERKTSPGHTGFVCYASPEVTLDEDLLRRDLTINAIARSGSGEIKDPLGGLADLASKSLRHVSDAFMEDPLRVLRVARFYSRFYHLGFTVHPETTALIVRMVNEGQLAELTPERIHGELDKALNTKDPAAFFDYLLQVGAHEWLWPEITKDDIDNLRRVSSTTIASLQIETCFAALTMNLDSAELTKLCQRLKCSNNRTQTSGLVVKFLAKWIRLDDLNAEEIISLLQQTDALRKSARFNAFNEICANISNNQPLAVRWSHLQDLVANVRAGDIETQATGPALGKAIREAQTRLVKAAISSNE